jgi:hypothetical protein
LRSACTICPSFSGSVICARSAEARARQGDGERDGDGDGDGEGEGLQAVAAKQATMANERSRDIT